MPVLSMTGFARFECQFGETFIVWEIRSVNGKGLDLRMRLPPGHEEVEQEVRRLAAARLSRGNIQIALTVRRPDDALTFTVNEAMLSQVLLLSDRLIASGHAVTPTSDGILSVKGIIDVADDGSAAEMDQGRRAAILTSFGEALDQLVVSRAKEGEALRAVLGQRLAEIGALLQRADADPARTADAIHLRLRRQVEELIQASALLDEQRLHFEAALLATRGDIRKELDRFRVHVDAAAALLQEGGPIGRRLDFLSQEFNRESNTICSKSNASSLTAIGLDMKIVVEQFREQVQNIE